MMAACGPEAPQDTDTTADPDGTATTTTTSTSTDAPTTGSTTAADTSTTTDGTASTTEAATVTSTTEAATIGEPTETESSTTGAPGPCCVAPDAPTSSVQAVTPVGTRSLPWAVYSISGGECGGRIALYLYPQASDVDTGHDKQHVVEHMEILVSSYMGQWPDGFIGTGPATVAAQFDGQSASVEGEITILEYVGSPEEPLWCDPEETPAASDAHVSFTIALKADGWDVAGEVLASYCPALNTICP